MIINLTAYLRSISLVLVVLFVPVSANAYTSSGADGLFQPTASMTFNSTQSIFDFTDISIPTGVTLDFSGLALTQPIELLATGNIGIAGTISLGTNSLWIETPGSLSFSGTVNGSGGTLTMVANTVNVSGIINMTGGNISLATNSAVGTITDGGANGTICISNNCSDISLINGGSNYLNPILLGGTLITGGGGTISLGPVPDLSLAPVPEPSAWAMLIFGFFVLYTVARLRDKSLHLA